MKFSIVTVAFKDLAGLKKTGQSIAAQVCRDYEWIICDGDSGVDVVRFLESLGQRAKWVSEPDRGIYDAMNRGVSMSSGDYVVFMNAGDLFHNGDTLSRVEDKLQASSGADILFGGAMLSFPRSGMSVYRPPRLVEKSLWHGLPANHQATYYRKALLDKTPYDLRYRLCGDYYLSASLLRNGAIAEYLDHPLAVFEAGGQSYKQMGRLFFEPYLIQRDVLSLPFYVRAASVMKRFVSTAGFMLLSQPIFKKKNNKAVDHEAV